MSMTTKWTADEAIRQAWEIGERVDPEKPALGAVGALEAEVRDAHARIEIAERERDEARARVALLESLLAEGRRVA